ncbi:MAG: TlpA family protein disulfide reductase [Tannerellaceae bacterium]|nr:TlpA family protein disulfide reductase [Tannerellaceae bacterium]
MKNRFYPALSCMILFSLFSSCIKESEESDYPYLEQEIEVGDIVPVFTVYEKEDQTGASFSSTQCEGKITVIVFFNTGCKDCRRELPKINYAWDTLRDDPLYQIVPIARDQGKEEIEAFWKDPDYTFSMPAYVDPGRKVYTLFANQTVPRVYIVNQEGVISWMAIEELTQTKEQFTELLRKMQ